MKTITDNGEQIEVSDRELRAIRHMVYCCKLCGGDYHTRGDYTFDMIEERLKERLERINKKKINLSDPEVVELEASMAASIRGLVLKGQSQQGIINYVKFVLSDGDYMKV